MYLSIWGYENWRGGKINSGIELIYYNLRKFLRNRKRLKFIYWKGLVGSWENLFIKINFDRFL